MISNLDSESRRVIGPKFQLNEASARLFFSPASFEQSRGSAHPRLEVGVARPGTVSADPDLPYGPSTVDASSGENEVDYVFSNFHSNFWISFGKL